MNNTTTPEGRQRWSAADAASSDLLFGGSLIGLDVSPQLLWRTPAAKAAVRKAQHGKENNPGNSGMRAGLEESQHLADADNKTAAAGRHPSCRERGVDDSIPLFTESPFIRGRREARGPRAGLPPKPPPAPASSSRAQASAQKPAQQQQPTPPQHQQQQQRHSQEQQHKQRAWRELLDDSSESCATFAGAATPAAVPVAWAAGQPPAANGWMGCLWTSVGASTDSLQASAQGGLAAAPVLCEDNHQQHQPLSQQQPPLPRRQQQQQGFGKVPISASWFGDPGKWTLCGSATSSDFELNLGGPPQLDLVRQPDHQDRSPNMGDAGKNPQHAAVPHSFSPIGVSPSAGKAAAATPDASCESCSSAFAFAAADRLMGGGEVGAPASPAWLSHFRGGDGSQSQRHELEREGAAPEAVVCYASPAAAGSVSHGGAQCSSSSTSGVHQRSGAASDLLLMLSVDQSVAQLVPPAAAAGPAAESPMTPAAAKAAHAVPGADAPPAGHEAAAAEEAATPAAIGGCSEGGVELDAAAETPRGGLLASPSHAAGRTALPRSPSDSPAVLLSSPITTSSPEQVGNPTLQQHALAATGRCDSRSMGGGGVMSQRRCLGGQGGEAASPISGPEEGGWSPARALALWSSVQRSSSDDGMGDACDGDSSTECAAGGVGAGLEGSPSSGAAAAVGVEMAGDNTVGAAAEAAAVADPQAAAAAAAAADAEAPAVWAALCDSLDASARLSVSQGVLQSVKQSSDGSDAVTEVESTPDGNNAAASVQQQAGDPISMAEASQQLPPKQGGSSQAGAPGSLLQTDAAMMTPQPLSSSSRHNSMTSPWVGSPILGVQRRALGASAATAAAADCASPALSDASFAAAAAAGRSTPYFYSSAGGACSTPGVAGWWRGVSQYTPGTPGSIVMSPLGRTWPPATPGDGNSSLGAEGVGVGGERCQKGSADVGSGWGVSGSMELAVNPVAVQFLLEQVGGYERRVAQLEALLQQAASHGSPGTAAAAATTAALLAELRMLRQQLAYSEREGSGALDALAAIMDLMALGEASGDEEDGDVRVDVGGGTRQREGGDGGGGEVTTPGSKGRARGGGGGALAEVRRSAEALMRASFGVLSQRQLLDGGSPGGLFGAVSCGSPEQGGASVEGAESGEGVQLDGLVQEQVSSVREQLERSCQELREKLEASEAALTSARAERDEWRATAHAAGPEAAAARERADAAEAEVEELHAQVAAAQSRAAAASEEAAAANESSAAVQQQMEQVLEELREVKSCLAQAEGEVADARGRVKEAEWEAGAMKKQAEAAKRAVEEAEGRLREQGELAGKAAEAAKESREHLQARCEAAECRLQEASIHNERLEARLASLAADNAQLRAAADAMADAEADGAAQQLELGQRLAEAAEQLHVERAARRAAEEANLALAAQNRSLAAMASAQRPAAGGAASSKVNGGGVEACLQQGRQADRARGAGTATDGVEGAEGGAAAADGLPPAAGAPPAVGRTPRTRRMAAANAQLERRCHQLAEENAALLARCETLTARARESGQKGVERDAEQAPLASVAQQGCELQDAAMCTDITPMRDAATECSDLMPGGKPVSHDAGTCTDECMGGRGKHLTDAATDTLELCEEERRAAASALARATAAANAAAAKVAAGAKVAAAEAEALCRERDNLRAALAVAAVDKEGVCTMLQQQLAAAESARRQGREDAQQLQVRLAEAQSAAAAAAAECEELRKHAMSAAAAAAWAKERERREEMRKRCRVERATQAGSGLVAALGCAAPAVVQKLRRDAATDARDLLGLRTDSLGSGSSGGCGGGGSAGAKRPRRRWADADMEQFQQPDWSAVDADGGTPRGPEREKDIAAAAAAASAAANVRVEQLQGELQQLRAAHADQTARYGAVGAQLEARCMELAHAHAAAEMLRQQLASATARAGGGSMGWGEAEAVRVLKMQVAAMGESLTASEARAKELQRQRGEDSSALVARCGELQRAQERAAALEALLRQAQEQQQVAWATVGGAPRSGAGGIAEGDESTTFRRELDAAAGERAHLVVELQQAKIAVDYLEGAVRRLGQHNASLASQLEKALEAAPHKQPRLVAPPPSAQPSAPPAAEAAAAPDADGDAQCAVDASAQMKRAGVGDAVDLQLVAAPAAPPVSPRTLQRVLRAASRVHEKNKQLKVALEAMECAQQRQQKQQP